MKTEKMSPDQKKAFEALEQILKSPTLHPGEIGKALVLYEHRTHQQTVTRNVMWLLGGIAEAMVSMEGDDARNEAAKEFCIQYLSFLKETEPYLPYI